MKKFFKRVETLNLILSAGCLVVCFVLYGLTWSWYSALFGVGASILNVRVLGILSKRLIARGGVAAPVGIFVGKFALLLIICYVLVVVLKADVIPFIAGLSTGYLSLVLAAMVGLEVEPAENEENGQG